jgi:hypothetical protein
MNNGRYVLDDRGEPLPCEDLLTWAAQFERQNRSVARDVIGETTVSTIFLGLDHSFDGGAPVLWETCVFKGPLNGEMDRYTSRAAALAGHAAMVAKVRALA